MIWYPWLDGIYQKILISYYNKKGHHAVLINSQHNNGEGILIYTIIRWLMCVNPIKDRYCDICKSCKLMSSGNHPNYYLIDSKNYIQFIIGIDTIRTCIDAIYRRTFHGLIKIIFIQYIEHVTDQGINALLKVIEDPPINTYFFFRTKRYMQISLTLLSRCICWSISSPEEKIGLNWLMNQKKIENITCAQSALRLCNQSPIEARDLLVSSSWEKRLKLCNAMRYGIINNDFLSILPYIDTFYYDQSLYWLISVLIDALKYRQKVNNKYIVNIDQINLITMVDSCWDFFSACKQLQKWIILFFYFQKFVSINRTLLLTYRLLNWNQSLVKKKY